MLVLTSEIADELIRSQGLDVTIPDIYTSIEGGMDGAFFSKNLTSVVIPDSVTTIAEFAFHDNQLTSVVIPDTVTSIGRKAFGNNSLRSVAIPDSVISIGDAAFDYNDLTSILIGNSVSSIGDSAFQGNKLTSIDIPDSVASIGQNAFQFNSLESLVIPDSVTSIEKSAFASNNLTSIEIPDSVTFIGASAFKNNQLSAVTVPNIATSLLELAFDDDVVIDRRGTNDSPIIIAISNSIFDENIQGGAAVATLSSIDPDPEDTHTYSLVSGSGDTDNSAFTIEGDQLKINASPDYELQDSYTVRVQTEDSGGLTFEKTFTFSVNDLNENPTPTPEPTPVPVGSRHMRELIDYQGLLPDINPVFSGELYLFSPGFRIASTQLDSETAIFKDSRVLGTSHSDILSIHGFDYAIKGLINSKEGDDILQISGNGNFASLQEGDIYLGDGDDILLANGFLQGGFLDSGAGSDYVQVRSSYGSFYYSGMYRLGKGDDYIVSRSDEFNATNDLINIGSDNLMVEIGFFGEEGNDTFDILLGNAFVDGGEGSDELILDLGNLNLVSSLPNSLDPTKSESHTLLLDDGSFIRFRYDQIDLNVNGGSGLTQHLDLGQIETWLIDYKSSTMAIKSIEQILIGNNNVGVEYINLPTPEIEPTPAPIPTLIPEPTLERWTYPLINELETITVSEYNINEGDSFTISIATTDFKNLDLFYSIVGGVDANDFSENAGLTGRVTIDEVGNASIVREALADMQTEGGNEYGMESLSFDFYLDEQRTQKFGSSPWVTINDSSKTPTPVQSPTPPLIPEPVPTPTTEPTTAPISTPTSETTPVPSMIEITGSEFLREELKENLGTAALIGTGTNLGSLSFRGEPNTYYRAKFVHLTTDENDFFFLDSYQDGMTFITDDEGFGILFGGHVLNDGLYEGAETFEIQISDPYTSENLYSRTFTVEDNSNPSVSSIFSIDQPTPVTEGEIGKVIIRRTGNVDSDIAVNYEFHGGSSGGGPASPAKRNSDFKSVQDFVFFKSGESEKEVTFETIDDDVVEPPEGFSIIIQAKNDAGAVFSEDWYRIGRQVIEIVDNDQLVPTPTPEPTPAPVPTPTPEPDPTPVGDPPNLIKATLRGQNITLQFDNSIADTLPTIGRFTLNMRNREYQIVDTEVRATEGIVRLITEKELDPTVALTLDYLDFAGDQALGVIESSTGVDLESFTGFALNNQGSQENTLTIDEGEFEGNQITLFLSAPISDAVPSKRRFKVKSANKKQRILDVTTEPDDGIVVLTTKKSLDMQESIFVSYRDLGGDQVKGVVEDLAGNDMATISDFEIASGGNDAIAPMVSSATLDENTLSVEFDSIIRNTTISNKRFKVKVNGKKVRVLSATVEQDDSYVDLVLQPKNLRTIDINSSVTLAYKDPKGDQTSKVVEDIFGNDLDSFIGYGVEIVKI